MAKGDLVAGDLVIKVPKAKGFEFWLARKLGFLEKVVEDGEEQCQLQLWGCCHTPSRPTYVYGQGELLGNGIPERFWLTPGLSFPTCANCQMVYLAKRRHFRCKTNWLRAARFAEQCSVIQAQMKWMELLDGEVAEKEVAAGREVLDSLLPHTRSLDYKVGASAPQAPPSYEIVGVDWRNFRTTKTFTLHFWCDEPSTED